MGKRNELDMTSVQIRPVTSEDQRWVAKVLTRAWGDTRVVSYGRLHQADRLPGLVAEVEGELVGLATYRVEDETCELVSLNSLRSGMGIGSKLLEAVVDLAGQEGCIRLWLITTNDNLQALGFYLKRGFRLVAVRLGAVEESRRLKPEIPAFGQDGIPIRDELVLERELPGSPTSRR
jgi:ribosomal protein S18 acetylase RimI-like enzyme